MIKTIKARFRKGKIEPLEPIDLEEETEILVSILTPTEPAAPGEDGTTPTFGVFKEDPTWEALEREINDRRLPEVRPEKGS